MRDDEERGKWRKMKTEKERAAPEKGDAEKMMSEKWRGSAVPKIDSLSHAFCGIWGTQKTLLRSNTALTWGKKPECAVQLLRSFLEMN